MNNNDRTRLAAFISQRMELGDSEWYINPVALNEQPPEKTGMPFNISENPQRNNPAMQKKSDTPGSSQQFTDESLQNHSTLDALNDAVSGCMRCSLGETRLNFVFGSGDRNADILFIGEAPGKDEDEQGLPFIGRAGKLLTKMIQAIKLEREDVFIANILKCRPPQNRDPKPDEINKCEPILLRQIEIIKPKVICALGRISGQTLLRTKSTLGELRGIVHDYHGVKLIVTYHPAALLRNPNWKAPAWEDMKFLRREYDGLEL